MISVYWALEVAGVTRRIWSGIGDITIAGQSYDGVGEVVSISERVVAEGIPDIRLSFSYSLSASQFAAALQDIGALPATVRYLYDSGSGIVEAEQYRITGFLNGATINNGVYTVELETYGAQNNLDTVTWSNAAQKMRNATDNGLSDMVKLSQGGVQVRWPNY